MLVSDIILNITSQEHLTFTLLHIGSRLFELFSKEVRVKKQPGMSIKLCSFFEMDKEIRSLYFNEMHSMGHTLNDLCIIAPTTVLKEKTFGILFFYFISLFATIV